MSSRLDALRAKFESSEIDGILIGSDENRRYVSGFVGTAGNLIITADEAVLATDFRYIEQAGKQAPRLPRAARRRRQPQLADRPAE